MCLCTHWTALCSTVSLHVCVTALRLGIPSCVHYNTRPHALLHNNVSAFMLQDEALVCNYLVCHFLWLVSYCGSTLHSAQDPQHHLTPEQDRLRLKPSQYRHITISPNWSCSGRSASGLSRLRFTCSSPVYLIIRLFSLRGGGVVGGVVAVQKFSINHLFWKLHTKEQKQNKDCSYLFQDVWSEKKRKKRLSLIQFCVGFDKWEVVFGGVRCSVQLDGAAVLMNFLTLLLITRAHQTVQQIPCNIRADQDEHADEAAFPSHSTEQYSTFTIHIQISNLYSWE